jgi:hypothetical protein
LAAIKHLDIGDAAFGEQLKATDLISVSLTIESIFPNVFSPLSLPLILPAPMNCLKNCSIPRKIWKALGSDYRHA